MNMVIQIAKEIRAFMIVFFAFVLTISVTLKALRYDLEFIELWQVAYRLGYGDFEEEYATHAERILFLIGTILLPLVLLNLLIAIMGEKYGRLQSDKKLSDIQERLSMIVEIGKMIRRCRRRSRQEYMHCVSTDLILSLDQEQTELDDTVTSIRSAINASDVLTNKKILTLNSKITGIEEKVTGQIDSMKKKLNTKIEDLGSKMDKILARMPTDQEN